MLNANIKERIQFLSDKTTSHDTKSSSFLKVSTEVSADAKPRCYMPFFFVVSALVSIGFILSLFIS